MDYKKYISLFLKTQDTKISDIIDDDFYQEIVICQENNQFYSIEDRLKDIMLSFIANAGINKFDIQKLRKKLIRQYLWTRTLQHKLQYDVFHLVFIHHGVKDKCYGDDVDLISAMTIAIYLLERDMGYREDDFAIEHTSTKQVKSVEACRYFRQKNFDISVKDGEVKFNNIDVIFKQLDYQAMKLGKIVYISFIKNLIKTKLDVKSGLYKFPIASDNQDNETIFPLGLIFQLSLKYINTLPVYLDEEIQDAYNKFLEFSKNYALLFECQNFGHDFEMTLMSDSNNLFNKIEEIIRTDSLYKVEQYIYSDVFEFVRFIAEKFLQDKSCKNEIENFLHILDFINSRIGMNKMSFRASEIPDKFGENFIENFVFINGINKEFICFHDFEKLDFNNKIIIKNNDVYKILHPQFFSIALYRILYKIIENNSNDAKNLNSNIGDYIEDFLEYKMREKFFDALYGRKYKIYKPQQQDLRITSNLGECDIILKSQKYLIFIEIKKKELTPNAKKGNILFILNDLGKILLTSQKQANKHMRYISKFKEIKFFKVDEKPEVTVELGEREILKISVSSLDYLSLHSKVVFQKFIRLLYNKEVILKNKVSSEESKIVNSFNELNKELSEELNNLNSDFQIREAHGFYNSFFMNIFHIVFLLNKSNDLEEFTARLISNRGIIMPYKDFYHESIYIEELKQSNVENN